MLEETQKKLVILFSLQLKEQTTQLESSLRMQRQEQ